MKFKATEEQIKQIAANAVNAAQPMGMGFLHYTPRVFKAEEFTCTPFGLDLDYVQGRMVKLYLSRKKDSDEWEIVPDPPRTDYQSWAEKYPTCADLIGSVIKQV